MESLHMDVREEVEDIMWAKVAQARWVSFQCSECCSAVHGNKGEVSDGFNVLEGENDVCE